MERSADDDHRASPTRLVARALDGDPWAWGELVRRHSHRVRLALLARGVGWDTAEDLLQETWMRLIHQQRTGRLTRLELPGLAIAQAEWLAREAARTMLRRQTIAPTTVMPECESWELAEPRDDSDPAMEAERADRIRMAQRALAECPPRMRRVVERAYGREGGTHADVARDLGLSVQRVRQTLCEARARMHRALATLEKEMDG